MIYDDKTDMDELNQLFARDTAGQDHQLLKEIVEEEKIGEIVAKEDEKKLEAHQSDEDDKLS